MYSVFVCTTFMDMSMREIYAFLFGLGNAVGEVDRNLLERYWAADMKRQLSSVLSALMNQSLGQAWMHLFIHRAQ